MKIIVFGVGSSYKDFAIICNSLNLEIEAYVDNGQSNTYAYFEGKPIVSPEKINDYVYDFIVITAQKCDEIEEQLLTLGVPHEKIIKYNLESSEAQHSIINKDIVKLNGSAIKVGVEPYSICNIRNIGRTRKIDFTNCVDDYVRLSSLELVADEINSKNIQGNVAELGVFRGDFASRLNQVFDDRKLFLFDTFEGFEKSDTAYDRQNNLSSSCNNEYSDTSVELVMSKMPHPELCIIRKGYFPDSAIDLDERFVFVSIDADLYKPIYSGLQWFYPRMVKGGFIFIHDYNNMRFVGAKRAVRDFAQEMNITVFPLTDLSGSAVILI